MSYTGNIFDASVLVPIRVVHKELKTVSIIFEINEYNEERAQHKMRLIDKQNIINR